MGQFVGRSGFLIPANPIDVATWPEDEQFAQYPEGARPKSAFFPPSDSCPPFINPRRRQLFKRSSSRYPDQFWTEVVAYHIGCLMEIEVPPAYPAVHSQADQCGSLIEWFYEDGSALFIMGGQFMQQVIPDFDRKRGRQHNFYSIQVLFRALQQGGHVPDDWLKAWVQTFLFDAICGNTDRHQDNWGLLAEPLKGGHTFRLSPCYDNGTSLGHELNERDHGEWDENDLLTYTLKGRHHIKWTLGAKKGEKHCDLLKLLGDLPKAPLMEAVKIHVENLSLDELRRSLDFLTSIEMPIPLTAWRADLIFNLVRLRRAKLLATFR